MIAAARSLSGSPPPMPKRVSHSFLDPYVGPPIKALYRFLPIPRGYPPEGIIAVGHLFAIGGAFGFAYSTSSALAAICISFGVAGNHVADCLDGTHARSTGQCRNGGELLDHFTDPLSFAYWLVGWGVSVGRLDLAIVALILLFATAVLTNIKAKMLGEFTLAAFGPTEFKTLLVLYGIVLAGLVAATPSESPLPAQVALWGFIAIIAVGAIQLLANLIGSVREVNANGAPPDTSEWENRK